MRGGSGRTPAQPSAAAQHLATQARGGKGLAAGSLPSGAGKAATHPARENSDPGHRGCRRPGDNAGGTGAGPSSRVGLGARVSGSESQRAEWRPPQRMLVYGTREKTSFCEFCEDKIKRRGRSPASWPAADRAGTRLRRPCGPWPHSRCCRPRGTGEAPLGPDGPLPTRLTQPSQQRTSKATGSGHHRNHRNADAPGASLPGRAGAGLRALRVPVQAGGHGASTRLTGGLALGRADTARRLPCSPLPGPSPEAHAPTLQPAPSPTEHDRRPVSHLSGSCDKSRTGPCHPGPPAPPRPRLGTARPGPHLCKGAPCPPPPAPCRPPAAAGTRPPRPPPAPRRSRRPRGSPAGTRSGPGGW